MQPTEAYPLVLKSMLLASCLDTKTVKKTDRITTVNVTVFNTDIQLVIRHHIGYGSLSF